MRTKQQNDFEDISDELIKQLKDIEHGRDFKMNTKTESYKDYIKKHTVGKNDVSYDGSNYHVSTMHIPLLFEDHYETCIFFNGSSEVVEVYDSEDAAKRGHLYWFRKIDCFGYPFKNETEKL